MRNRFDLTQLLISKIAKGKECVSGLEQPRFRSGALMFANKLQYDGKDAK